MESKNVLCNRINDEKSNRSKVPPVRSGGHGSSSINMECSGSGNGFTAAAISADWPRVVRSGKRRRHGMRDDIMRKGL